MCSKGPHLCISCGHHCLITHTAKVTSRHTHTHTRLTAPCPGLPGGAGTKKVKPVWILLEQETVSGSGISWAICVCTSLQTDNHASTPPLSLFTGRMPFLPPNQQRQSTEGSLIHILLSKKFKLSICVHNEINGRGR